MKHSKQLSLLVLMSLVLMVGCTPTVTTPSATEIPLPTRTPVPTAIPAPTEEPAGWQVVHQLEVTHTIDVAGFLGDSFGITVGGAFQDRPNGTVAYTTDGGQTWTTATIDGACRFGLDIVDEQTIWACGRGIARQVWEQGVSLSTDGGQSWSNVSQIAGRGTHATAWCRYLGFVDDQTGWAASVAQLSATADGGATWTDVTLPEGIQEIVAIAHPTADDGYILDNTGVLYATRDGGQSWSSQQLVSQEPMYIPSFAESGIPSSAAMRFFDADHGLVVVDLIGGGENKVLALRTSDGGQTWQQEEVPAPFGVLYLSQDGTTLTAISALTPGQIVVARYQQ